MKSANVPSGVRAGQSISHRHCIAFFSEEPSVTAQGGSPPFLRLLRAFPREARIIFNTPASGAQPSPWDEASGIEFSHRPAYGGSIAGFLLRLPWILLPTWRCIRQVVSRADVVVSQFPSPVLPLVVRAVRREKKPHILYIVGDVRDVVAMSGKYSWFVRRLLAAPIAEAMHRLALRASKGGMIIAASQSLAQLYASTTHRSVAFAPTSVAGNEIFDREDTCQSTPTRLLFVGRLVPVKGLVYLLEAVRLLSDDGVPVCLKLVGAGPQRKALTAMVAELALTPAVEFAGEVPFGPDLLAHYRGADAFVLPSLSEGTPRVLWEAMAAGLPIVASRVGGIPEIIRHDGTGLLVNPRSARQLAKSIRRLIEDDELRLRLIRAGYSLVRSHTVEKQASTLWEHITAFLESGPA